MHFPGVFVQHGYTDMAFLFLRIPLILRNGFPSCFLGVGGVRFFSMVVGSSDPMILHCSSSFSYHIFNLSSWGHFRCLHGILLKGILHVANGVYRSGSFHGIYRPTEFSHIYAGTLWRRTSC